MVSFSTTPATTLAHYPYRRLRRYREQPAMRHLVAETHLRASDLIAPLFIVSGTKQRIAVSSMPGVFKMSIDCLIEEVMQLQSLGVNAVNLFPCLPAEEKDKHASAAFSSEALTIQAIRAIRQAAPAMCIMADVALDPFTDHGHDGIVDDSGHILNDATIDLLIDMSLLYAEAGIDVIAPSDMMDGRVGAIRHALDNHGYQHVSILSYAAKFASAFYGPFREALASAPRFGDKKTYQLNPANGREALLECQQDEAEGADILMVKPALPYLDIIAKLRSSTLLPIAAFHVSGEYAMAHAAAANGWVDADKVLAESLIAIKRAGADLILTWGARQVAEQLASGRFPL
jgi:porphobilinogen synthase